MAILQLRLDVDSDVHPELHAVLSAIGRAASRAERLRQLASNGLIWEHLRVRAHPPAQVDASGGIDTIVDAPRAEPVAQTSRAPAPAPAPVAVAVAVAVEGAGSNAKPTRQRSLPSRNIPILSDAVDLGAVADRKRIATGQRAAISASEKRAVQVVPNRVDAALPGAAVEPAPPPGRTAGPRPRMMRMKEKGLFNNG